jgi:RNA polymerase sigma-70 factor (ECF subfamily)
MEPSTERFYALVWPQLPLLVRVARALVRNESDADDLVQETMLKAHRSLESFRAGTNIKAWLVAIVRNDRLRAGRRERANVSLDSLDDAPESLAAVDAGSERDWENPEEILEAFSDAEVIDALGKLPEEIRWTLLLVDVEGMDHRDAAGALQVPVGTIKSRTHRGRVMLREMLAPVARDRRLIRD